jgi:serine/threonine protein kinase
MVTETPQVRILVIPYYNESLETLKIENVKMLFNIMKSAITILSHIHNNYVVHRDIKPANFMIHNDELILIDFGLASFYVDSDERHIPPANPKKTHIIGTPKYVSWNVHCGEEYSRRDDLMSVVYIGLFLLYGSANLWTDVPGFYSVEEKTAISHPKNQWFKQQKTANNVKHMFINRNCTPLAMFAEEVYSLSFQERPSYTQLLRIFDIPPNYTMQ